MIVCIPKFQVKLLQFVPTLYVSFSHTLAKSMNIFPFFGLKEMGRLCLPTWRWSFPVQTCGNNIQYISNIVCSSAESEHSCWKFRSDPQQRNFNELKMYFLMHSRLSFYFETASHWSQTDSPAWVKSNKWMICLLTSRPAEGDHFRAYFPDKSVLLFLPQRISR